MRSAMLQDPGRKESRMLGGAIVVAAMASTGLLMSQVALSEEPVYSVVSPLGEQTVEMIHMSPRLDTLSGCGARRRR